MSETINAKTDSTRSTESSALDNWLSFRLSVLSNTLSQKIEKIYGERHGLNLWQWRVMAVLSEGKPLRASDIVKRTAMDKVAVSRAVNGLENKGLVERDDDPDDGRMQLLNLTDEGLRVQSDILPQVEAVERSIRRALGRVNAAKLEALLNEVSEIVSPDEPLWRSDDQ